MALGEFDGGDATLTKQDLILRRADKIADKAIEKAADERKSGSEARKDASEARKRFMSKAERMVGGGGETSKTVETPEMRVGDRVWSKGHNKWVELRDLGKDRATISMQSGMGSVETHVPTSDLLPRNKGVAKNVSSGSRGGGGGGGMNPADIEKVPGKRPLKMKTGGVVKSSASKRADGCATKGKTRGRMM